MKKLFILVFIVIFCSCLRDYDSIYNYRGSVVVEKFISNFSKQETVYSSSSYFVRIRVGKDKYTIETIKVTEFEYNQVELGDTIK
jgi:hypothetical protein